MIKTRMLLGSLLGLMILLAAISAQADPLVYSRGDTVKDFTFTTYDGETYTFYDLMKGKDAVLINIWATWCGPCRNEFPYMQEAYDEYKDRIEVIALSCESTDTPQKLAEFAQKYGLTFKIGQDPVGFLEALGMTSIPTTLMVDRFGTICFVEAGAQPDADSFKRLFEAFLGNDYTESILLDAIPSVKPKVAPSDEVVLAEAIGSVVKNPTNAYVWPMIVTEKDGRNVVASTNSKQTSTRAEVTAFVEAKAGNAIVVTFKTSTEAVFDLMTISVNGRTVKSFGGDHDWMTYAIPVEADATYAVKISYVKDSVSDAGEDMVWVDSIAVAEDAVAALAANPEYPTAEKNGIYVTNTQAQEVAISDPHGLLKANFGEARYYVINKDTADIKVTLDDSVDPERALLYFSFDKSQLSAMQAMTHGGYSATTGVDSMAATKYLCSYAVLYLDAVGGDRMMAILFRDEENLNHFVQQNSLGEWHYVDGAEGSALSTVDEDGMSEYILRCIDQDGNAVAGVMLQVCNDETCQVLVTDTNGVCEFTALPYAWEVHILRAPAGYAADSTAVVLAPLEGGEMLFKLTVN